MTSVPVSGAPTTSINARTTVCAPPQTYPKRERDECTITVSPPRSPRARSSFASEVAVAGVPAAAMAARSLRSVGRGEHVRSLGNSDRDVIRRCANYEKGHQSPRQLCSRIGYHRHWTPSSMSTDDCTVHGPIGMSRPPVVRLLGKRVIDDIVLVEGLLARVFVARWLHPYDQGLI